MAGALPQSTWQRALTHAWLRRGPLAYLLLPVALLFGGVAAVRRTMYRLQIIKPQRLRVPVVVVGNVVAGGSGKTPVTMALVRHLQAQGLPTGVISRGYGRTTTACLEVLANSPATEVGDEPALIKRATDAPVFVANHRYEAATTLLENYPDTQVILCDDGLQHLSLDRDLEICVFDDRGIGNGFLLPAGPLREPWPRSVDLVLHTGAKPAFAGFRATRTLATYALDADGRQSPLSELAKESTRPFIGLAAIAKPDEFFTMLRTAGVTLSRTIALPDHFNFDNWSPQDYQDYTIICTEKDAVKLWSKVPKALAVPLCLQIESDFFKQFDTLMARIRRHLT